jgi:hypothetical protein
MIRAGEEAVPAASRRGVRACVMVKTRVRFRVSTRVHALSGNSSYGAPQFDPLLLTRTCSLVSRFFSSSARRLQSSSL